MLVNDFLEQSAARTPDKLALICGERRLTYAELDGMANRLANALQAHGVQRGDRVALYLPNTVELVVAIFATLKANGVFVVINSSTKQDKLLYMVNNCRAVGLVTRTRETAVADTLLANAPSLKFAIFSEQGADAAAQERERAYAFDAIQANYPNTCPPRRNIDQDLACLIYTSGSTGDPKGVMSAHSNVVFAASSIITYLENRPDDIVINALPLSFDYGLYQLLMVFKFGGTLVLERSFTFPAQILQKIATEKVTGFPGVPTVFAILLTMDLSKYDLSSLRYITNTAAALPPSHIQQIRDLFPWATLYSMYGLTETKRTLYLPPAELDRRPGSVGVAIPGTEVWVEDENGTRLGAGQIGELVIRGGHVMRGYWENAEATAVRYRPGPIPGERLCYSGDLFRMDEEGFFYFVARKDDIIKSRGEKVAPKEVETVLYGIAGVKETAVIGIPDPILGEAIKAFIVTDRDDLTDKEVLRHCRANLEDFMVPQIVEFRSELPKTSSGKITKKELR
ncbi:MAG: AMP-binding protein [Anaerolineales bacterium]|nr:AMP-binding protein [Anaerolineales bacterium]